MNFFEKKIRSNIRVLKSLNLDKDGLSVLLWVQSDRKEYKYTTKITPVVLTICELSRRYSGDPTLHFYVLTLLEIFTCFCGLSIFFSKSTFSKKNISKYHQSNKQFGSTSRKAIRPDPDLGLICFQGLSTDDESRRWQEAHLKSVSFTAKLVYRADKEHFKNN